MNTEFAVKLTPESMIPLPESLQRELGLKPLQTLYLRMEPEHHRLIIQLITRQEIGDRIVGLMNEAFEGVTESDIQAGRRDNTRR